MPSSEGGFHLLYIILDPPAVLSDFYIFEVKMFISAFTAIMLIVYYDDIRLLFSF